MSRLLLLQAKVFDLRTLGILHRHLERVLLALLRTPLAEVLHYLLVPRLEARGQLALGGSLLVSHFC